MKYDLVIGNPPYQSDKRGKKLWPEFIKKAMMMTKDDGVVAMLTPPGFLKSTTAETGKYLRLMIDNGLKTVKTGQEKYFSVGTPIAMWICDKTHKGNFTVDGQEFDRDTVNVPRDVSDTFISIMNKVKSQDEPLTVYRTSPGLAEDIATYNATTFKRLNHLGSNINASVNGENDDLFHFTSAPKKMATLLNSKLFSYINKFDRHDPVIYHYYMSTYTYSSELDVSTDRSIMESYGLTENEMKYIENVG